MIARFIETLAVIVLIFFVLAWALRADVSVISPLSTTGVPQSPDPATGRLAVPIIFDSQAETSRVCAEINAQTGGGVARGYVVRACAMEYVDASTGERHRIVYMANPCEARGRSVYVDTLCHEITHIRDYAAGTYVGHDGWAAEFYPLNHVGDLP